MEKQALIEAIEKLKKEKNAIVLAHYYAHPDVQDIADFLGDSLELSRKAGSTDADIIVFCGVHFMAETAAIISPDKKVLIPALRAGCSLAESIEGEDLREWKQANPDGIIVSYVNTTAEVKAETDYCCTSANALKVIKHLPADKKILFSPDYNLGSYIQKVTGRKMEIWRGNCCVHQKITTDMIVRKIEEYPDADILIHPESICSHDDRILNTPVCYLYSTSGIIRHAKESPKKRFVIATENETIHKLQKDNPDKEFIPVDSKTICGSMKRVTLQGVYEALLEEKYQVKISPEICEKALLPIQRMMEIG